MDLDRERALTLAHEAEMKLGDSPPSAVIDRARVYLNFLVGKDGASVESADLSSSANATPAT